MAKAVAEGRCAERGVGAREGKGGPGWAKGKLSSHLNLVERGEWTCSSSFSHPARLGLPELGPARSDQLQSVCFCGADENNFHLCTSEYVHRGEASDDVKNRQPATTEKHLIVLDCHGLISFNCWVQKWTKAILFLFICAWSKATTKERESILYR